MTGGHGSAGGDDHARQHVYSVTELQSATRDLLESQGSFHVQGEISGAKFPRSGHCYLTLKDERAQLNAVIWRSTLVRLKTAPEDGLLVRARGHLTVYPERGSYQFIVAGLQPVGAGPLQVRFEERKAKLLEEGLFDPGHKQALPAFPRRVALITSPTGAAVRDLIAVAHRRWPAIELVVVPVRVQGPGAADEIADAIEAADPRGFDILVVGRGGGSLEDLWAFNEEVVARAIFAADTPVVSAVGHEIDTTIADFVADVRAATPSAAAETILPDRAEVRQVLDASRRRLARALRGKVRECRRDLSVLRAARPFVRPREPLREAGRALDLLAERTARALSDHLGAWRTTLGVLAARLEALSPLKVLARGYSVTLRGDAVVMRAADIESGDELRTLLADGEVRSRVV